MQFSFLGLFFNHDKIFIMVHIPLFPLNTVLFPGMQLHLHIFEERYKKMISKCIQENGLFGVVLIKSGVEAFGPLAEPYPIGCTAKMIKVEKIKGGVMNITVLGLERFRVLALDKKVHPYLTGLIQPYPIQNPNPDLLPGEAEKMRILIMKYIQRLLESDKVEFDPDQLPGDPIQLAHLAASVLQISAFEKQRILSITSAADLVLEISDLYKRELVFLEHILLRENPSQNGSFSLN